MKSILISHSNIEPDRTISLELYHYLSSRKIDCWIDALLKVGDWAEQIGKVMKTAPIVIFVASKNSMMTETADEVLGEVEYYHVHRKEGKIIIPFVLDMQYYLNPDDRAYKALYRFGANRLEAVFMEKYDTRDAAFERLVQLLPHWVSKLENNPDYFIYERGDEALVRYEGSDSCVTVPPYVNEIESEAFMNNESLINVIIPPSVEKIGFRAFFGCSNLVTVDGMDGLTEIEATAFDSSGIESAVKNGTYNGIAFGWAVKGDTLDIPSGTRIIANEAFRYCGAKEINFPQGLTHIGKVAFADSILIEKLRIPASVKAIGRNAFRGCRKLKSVVFEGEIPLGAEDAFEDLQKLISTEE